MAKQESDEALKSDIELEILTDLACRLWSAYKDKHHKLVEELIGAKLSVALLRKRLEEVEPRLTQKES